MTLAYNPLLAMNRTQLQWPLPNCPEPRAKLTPARRQVQGAQEAEASWKLQSGIVVQARAEEAQPGAL